MGRRNASGTDRRQWAGPPAGRGGPRRRDRTELSSRLRGAGVPLKLHGGARGRAADAVRPPRARRDRGHGDPPHKLQGPSRARVPHLRAGRRAMTTVVISVYKVANFPDGGGHFWAYMQYAAGLRRLGCEVYWLEQLRPLREPKRDPGLLQLWMSSGELAVPPHDCYLTTGETVGTSAARFPDCGLRWIYVGRPVSLEDWPAVYDPRCEAFTTVSSWSGASWLKVTEDGKTVLRENTKRVAFLPFVDLPRHTRQPLDLALYLVAHKDGADRARLESRGWRVCDSREVAGTPETYRAYIQRSRGEFSCAKPTCMELQNAWISDRTLCYLASGKPVVVQHTGPSSYLPHGEGMFRFTSLRDAAEALEEINAHYERHCRAARDIAETHFDSTRVLTTMLNAALGSGTAGHRAASVSVP